MTRTSKQAVNWPGGGRRFQPLVRLLRRACSSASALVSRLKFWPVVSIGVIGLLGVAAVASVGPGQKLTEWIEALATLAAFIAAIVAARYAAGAFRLENRRDELVAADRRAEQASMIAAWFESREESVRLNGRAIFPLSTLTVRTIVYRNASHVPVTGVTAAVWAVVYEPLLSGERRRECVGIQQAAVLPPAAEPVERKLGADIIEKMSSITDEVAQQGQTTHVEILVALYFTDSSGRRWVRDTEGQLRDVSEVQYKDPALRYS